MPKRNFFTDVKRLIRRMYSKVGYLKIVKLELEGEIINVFMTNDLIFLITDHITSLGGRRFLIKQIKQYLERYRDKKVIDTFKLDDEKDIEKAVWFVLEDKSGCLNFNEEKNKIEFNEEVPLAIHIYLHPFIRYNGRIYYLGIKVEVEKVKV